MHHWSVKHVTGVEKLKMHDTVQSQILLSGTVYSRHAYPLFGWSRVRVIPYHPPLDPLMMCWQSDRKMNISCGVIDPQPRYSRSARRFEESRDHLSRVLFSSALRTAVFAATVVPAPRAVGRVPGGTITTQCVTHVTNSVTKATSARYAVRHIGTIPPTRSWCSVISVKGKSPKGYDCTLVNGYMTAVKQCIGWDASLMQRNGDRW